MKKLVLLSITLFLTLLGTAQLVSIAPSGADGDDEITVTFDASQGNGELAGADKVYMHSGVVVESPTSTSWSYVIGNWGMDDGVGEMTQVSGTEKWELKLSPSARSYYGVPAEETIFRLSMVFRDASGGTKGTIEPGEYSWGVSDGNGDIFINLDAGAYVTIDQPTASQVFLETGESVALVASASSVVTEMSLLVNEGQGFSEVASVTSGTTISHDYTPSSSGEITIKVTATITGIEVEDSRTLDMVIRSATPVADLPAGVIRGINYDPADDSKVTLVLEAPDKEFAHVVGDFNDWTPSDEYLMNQTPDGEFFWFALNGLNTGQEYAFQYWVDGEVKIGDPYAEKVVDPWNDKFIPESVYPNLLSYDKTEYGIATVIQTGQAAYEWAASEDTWQRPSKSNLIVYELLVRDFVGSHSYKDLTDTLSYLKRLGVNAIELMPIMEFEGNESWGYNPSYFFAPDKYYGTKNELKKFIETAHQEGFAVILDMVLNHAFGQNALVQLYWDQTINAPSEDSPWFNQVARHPFNVGYDFNHESIYTKRFMDTVNHYWINEYHFDGYRFDLSKGFTQTNTGDDVGAWGQYDQRRVDLLKRMNNEIKSYDPTAYVILEHFADGSEEEVLGAEGMLLWRNSHFDFANTLKGSTNNIGSATSGIHVSYMESHDEERVMVEMLSGGQASGSYDIKNELVALERAKMAYAFLMMQKGPKMLWQFGELGYDVGINFNGRTGNKPLVWGDGSLRLYEDEFRQYLYEAYAAINELRSEYGYVINSGTVTSTLSGRLKKIVIDHGSLDIVLIGNYDTKEGTIPFDFTHTGTWYDYFTGSSVEVANTNTEMKLLPGEFKLFTDQQISDGYPNVVVPYQNPVTISPASFRVGDEIKIIFDATKASNDGTVGLVGADQVYLQAGVVLGDPKSSELSNEVTDNAKSEMTRVAGETDKWEITLTPDEYFNISSGMEAYRIGMFFRNSNGNNIGKGYRNQIIFAGIASDQAIAYLDPAEIYTTDNVSLIFDAGLGDQGLLNANKVYAHSGVVLTPGESPSFGSNVVGEWGMDNGVGQMTKIEGTNKWELKMNSLRDYYGLTSADSVHWISVVFRSADGSTKGSGSAGPFNGGLIDGNGDIYVKVNPPTNEPVLGAKSQLPELLIYPNPAKGAFRIVTDLPEYTLEILDMSGKVMLKQRITNIEDSIRVQGLRPGSYLIRTSSGNQSQSSRLIITD